MRCCLRHSVNVDSYPDLAYKRESFQSRSFFMMGVTEYRDCGNNLF